MKLGDEFKGYTIEELFTVQNYFTKNKRARAQLYIATTVNATSTKTTKTTKGKSAEPEVIESGSVDDIDMSFKGALSRHAHAPTLMFTNIFKTQIENYQSSDPPFAVSPNILNIQP